jgi:high-affinity nickel-transport protein
MSMLNLALAFATSLLLGMRHATDPDHVIAVSTIVSRERSIARATHVGVAWGLGHTLTILIVGMSIIAFRIAFTPVIGLSLEMSVAVMLIVLGMANLMTHSHAPVRAGPGRPFVVGVVHGLAGSASATLLIVPLIGNPSWAVLSLVVFGAGTVLGMALVTLAIAGPALLVASRVGRLQHSIRMFAGALSVLFGLYLAWKIGVGDGLIVGEARWTPS